MGATASSQRTWCESRPTDPNHFSYQIEDTSDPFVPSQPPPQMTRPPTVGSKVWEKFSKQPFVPIGCVVTAYFLGSGIRSFSLRDSRRSQKMMRLRVGAQFATLVIFSLYVGFDNIDWRPAPMYLDRKKADRLVKEQEEQERQQQQAFPADQPRW